MSMTKTPMRRRNKLVIESGTSNNQERAKTMTMMMTVALRRRTQQMRWKMCRRDRRKDTGRHTMRRKRLMTMQMTKKNKKMKQ